MKVIYVINPLTDKGFEQMTMREIEPLVTADVQLRVVSIDKGPASIECRYDEVIAAPYLVKKVEEIADKADAIVVNCFGDVGVEAAREVTRVPVIGPGSTSMALAQLLGHNFSVVTVLSRLAPLIEKIALELGTTKLKSVRAVNMPVLELEDRKKTVKGLTQESIKAIEEDGAQVIILGCTGMAGSADQLKNELTVRGYDLPVLDPLIVTLRLARVLIEEGLTPSRLTYPPPPEKERTGID